MDELLLDLPVYPVTLEVALRAGQIQGQRAAKGLPIPFEDLLIASTALQLGFSVATANIRHFQLVPGLNVVPA